MLEKPSSVEEAWKIRSMTRKANKYLGFEGGARAGAKMVISETRHVKEWKLVPDSYNPNAYRSV